MPCDQVITVTGDLALADLGLLADELIKNHALGESEVHMHPDYRDETTFRIYIPELYDYAYLDTQSRKVMVRVNRRSEAQEALAIATNAIQRVYTKGVIQEAARFGWNVEMDADNTITLTSKTEGGW